MLQDQDLLSIQEVRAKLELAYAAWTRYRSVPQSEADAIVEAMAAAARTHAQRLAERAVEETGYGNARDKFAKNMLAADVLPKRMRGMRTLGVLREIPDQKLVEIGVPMGVVAAILPTTNPTSTAIYKTLIALKAGNGIVLAPHPRARACTCESASILAEAAVKAGAPEGLIQCITIPTVEGTHELMRHRRTAVILSTGGAGIVRAAYSSGKPAYGVGPGNVPILVDISANIPEAIAKIVAGKSFDYGTLCSSEQTLVAEQSLRDRILAALKANHAHRCDIPQTAALERLLITKTFAINPDCVGQSPEKIAKMAGFEVAKDTSILTVEIGGIGKEHPLSAEKLSPVLSLYFVPDFAAALDACEAVLHFGGLGHTCGIYATDDTRIRRFAMRMPAYRVIANSATPTGSTGISTNLFPAMTLGCGAVAGNSTSDNIGPLHLINIKRLAYAVDATASMDIDPKSIDRAQIVSAVERFLAKRGAAPKQVVPPQPEVPIADFVCEDDVRKAIAQSKKIFIGPKSIVTPSARDLAGTHDILIMTKQ
jgi:acetaldehyde dehydrogenase (acetylating)